ncbi:hypothetical protein MSPP1_002259 [Malassezia sp. CBS 17886]|nr:hypothetical protein MSPP1_002259 [Malassezia sp. CBS 17886]
MASTEVQQQHTQVSSAGIVAQAELGSLLELLARKVSVPPEAFVERETVLRRVDDDAARDDEMSDSRWSNVLRAREQTRIVVVSAESATQFRLPLPPAPPGPNPTLAVRAVVLVDDFTRRAPERALPPLQATTIFAQAVPALVERAAHSPGWGDLVFLLNWVPQTEHLHYGLRFVLRSENPLVLHELRIFRSAKWPANTAAAPMHAEPSSTFTVRSMSTFRSDVGPGVPKRTLDDAARAAQYAIQHTQLLQKTLDSVVALRRDI